MVKMHTIIKRSIVILLVLVLAGVTFYTSRADTAWNPLYRILSGGRSLYEQREDLRFRSPDVIRIGIAGDRSSIKDNSLYYQGIELAVEEINRTNYLDGAEIETVIEDDGGQLSRSLEIAQKFSEDLSIPAVIGHWTSRNTLPVAHVYDQAGVVLFAPTVTNPQLTENGYHTVFRNSPSDVFAAAKLAEYASAEGCRNIAVIYSDSLTGVDLSLAFERSAVKHGINIIDRRTVISEHEDFEIIFKGWQYQDVDAVFIADIIMNVPELVKRIHEADPDLLILGSDGFDFGTLPDLLDEGAENTAFASFFSAQENSDAYPVFREKFHERFGLEPDYFAVKGYDTVYLIAQTILHADSTAPSDLLGVLASGYQFSAVNGSVIFDPNGDILTGDVIIKRVENGKIIIEDTN